LARVCIIKNFGGACTARGGRSHEGHQPAADGRPCLNQPHAQHTAQVDAGRTGPDSWISTSAATASFGRKRSAALLRHVYRTFDFIPCQAPCALSSLKDVLKAAMCRPGKIYQEESIGSTRVLRPCSVRGSGAVDRGRRGKCNTSSSSKARSESPSISINLMASSSHLSVLVMNLVMLACLRPTLYPLRVHHLLPCGIETICCFFARR